MKSDSLVCNKNSGNSELTYDFERHTGTAIV
jgi:hypothetical protein